MSSPQVWGEITFEPGLTKEEANHIDSLIYGVDINEGDKFVSFEDDYFRADEILFCFENKKDMDGSVEFLGDDFTETYIFKGDEIKQYEKDYVWHLSDEEMIEELKKRGYIITKGDK